MNDFCKTHVSHRTREELEIRREELRNRDDLAEKPGLSAELVRVVEQLELMDEGTVEVVTDQSPEPIQRWGTCLVCETYKQVGSDFICESCTEEGRVFAGSPQLVEALDSRPLDVPEDPPDAEILTKVIEEFERRYTEEPERLEVFRESQMLYEDVYKLGVADCIAYFRQLANGSTFQVQVIQPTEDHEETMP